MRMDVDGVGGGEMMRAMTHYVHGNAGGRAIAVFPPGIRRSHVTPSPSGNPNGILP